MFGGQSCRKTGHLGRVIRQDLYFVTYFLHLSSMTNQVAPANLNRSMPTFTSLGSVLTRAVYHYFYTGAAQPAFLVSAVVAIRYSSRLLTGSLAVVDKKPCLITLKKLALPMPSSPSSPMWPAVSPRQSSMCRLIERVTFPFCLKISRQQKPWQRLQHFLHCHEFTSTLALNLFWA